MHGTEKSISISVNDANVRIFTFDGREISLSLRIIKQFNEFIFICCHCKVLKSARWKALTYTAHSRRASFHLSIEKLYLPIQANVIIYIDSIN